VLPPGTPEPGPWRSSRTPYCPPIFAALAKFRRVVVMMGAQMGKTAGLLNVVGQRLDDAPVPMLYVGPTKSNVDRVIEPQLTAMLKSAPALWSKTDQSRKAQKLAKTVNGVSLRLAWAGSPTELASQPAHTVLIDEIDRMEPIPGEGDPVTLAEARTTNYAGGRIIITSTPTEGNVDVERNTDTGLEHWKVTDPKDIPSQIWKLWQEGTRWEWSVPCPHCRRHFIPRFRYLWWPKDATPRVASREARLVCPACGAQIEDGAREGMNAGGVFLAPGQTVKAGQVIGDPPDSDTASFWVSGLMSPWRTWGQRAADWIRALNSGDQERIRAIINLGFGEPYAFKGEAVPAEAVRDCIGAYKTGDVPAGVKALTCGVDVQKRRLVYVVRGWGYSMESWLIESGDIWGETDQRTVWDELALLLQRRFGEKTIQRMGIDSGYRPGDKWRRPDNLVYEFCTQHRGRALPTKGRDRLNKPLQPSLIDVTFRGQSIKKGLQLWHIDSDYFKSWIMARLSWPADQPGRFWVPEDVSDDYCLQVTAESRVSKPSGQAIWIKVRPENHFLDCEAINVAMAQSLGFHRRIRARKTDEATATEQQPRAAMPPPAPIPRRPMQPPRRSNWTTNW
jgi:phage terminase large subunit GpA-like protein